MDIESFLREDRPLVNPFNDTTVPTVVHCGLSFIKLDHLLRVRGCVDTSALLLSRNTTGNFADNCVTRPTNRPTTVRVSQHTRLLTVHPHLQLRHPPEVLMSTTKGTIYLQRLEQARCNSDWDAISELSRKVQKHVPGRKCLAMTAATEARIHQLLPPPPPNASPSTIVSYIVSLDALQDALQEELDRSPVGATRLPVPSGGGYSSVTTADDLIQARVTIAWVCMLKGEWEDVVKVIPGMREVSEEWVGGGKKDGYIEIARIKSLVLQGIALSHTNSKDLSIPLQLYRTAIRQAATLPAAQRASLAITEWTERALSHSALASYQCWLDNNSPSTPSPPATTCQITPRKHEKPRGDWKTDAEQAVPSPVSSEEDVASVGMAIGKTLVDEVTVLNCFKAFHRFISELPRQSPPTLTSPSQGSDPIKDTERREVYRHYFRFLSLLLLPSNHVDAPHPRTLPSSSRTASTVSLAGEAHARTPVGTPAQLRSELEMVQNIYEAYLLQTNPFPSADVFHSPIGEFVDTVCANWYAAGGSGLDAEGVSECLYRAATKTFHSPRILRHLFYVLASMGNLTDAVLSLETYLGLSENAAERIAKGKIEKDFDSAALVLITAADGIRMLSKHLGEGAKALKIAERCERWVREWKVRDFLVLGAVYKAIGTANATWARQTVMREERRDILEFAKKAFEKGLQYNPGDMCTWYGVSLVHADLGNTTLAIKALRKALKRAGNSDRERVRTAAVGHALAILLSSREEFEEAGKICTKALDLLSTSDPTILSVEEKTLALELQMTSMAIIEATSGPSVAVVGADTLLTLYTRLFPPPLVPTPSRVPTDPFPTIAVEEKRPSTASRISRMFTIKPNYEKQYSISANDLSATALNGCLPPVARPGTAKLGRPETATGAGLSQSLRIRPRSTYRSASKIRVSTEPPPTPGVETIPPSLAEIQAEKARRGRRYSVSGGTIRRSKSVKSTYSSSVVMMGALVSEIPPMPSSSTEVSTPATPSGSATGSGRASFSLSRASTSGGSRAGSGLAREFGSSDGERERREGVMFSVLKSKLQRVHGNGTFTPSVNGMHGNGIGNGGLNESGSFTPSRNGNGVNGNGSGVFTPATNGTKTGGNTGTTTPVSSTSVLDEKPNPQYINSNAKTNGNSSPKPRRGDIPNNLSRSTLPNPIAPLADTITDEKRPRTISRPRYLQEPILKEEDEHRRSEKALRTVWLFMAALYRRCGWMKDAIDAVEEAATVGGGWSISGEGGVKENGFGQRVGTWGGWGGRGRESIISVEWGLLALESADVEMATKWFEHALVVDANCPGAVVGLSQILLDAIPPPLHPLANPGKEQQKIRRPPFTPLKSETELQEGELMRQAKHARALNLLTACIESPRGWDCSEAWYLFAEALERDGDVEGAKKALWRVVEIEDGRGVRTLSDGAGVRVL